MFSSRSLQHSCGEYQAFYLLSGLVHCQRCPNKLALTGMKSASRATKKICVINVQSEECDKDRNPDPDLAINQGWDNNVCQIADLRFWNKNEIHWWMNSWVPEVPLIRISVTLKDKKYVNFKDSWSRSWFKNSPQILCGLLFSRPGDSWYWRTLVCFHLTGLQVCAFQDWELWVQRFLWDQISARSWSLKKKNSTSATLKQINEWTKQSMFPCAQKTVLIFKISRWKNFQVWEVCEVQNVVALSIISFWQQFPVQICNIVSAWVANDVVLGNSFQFCHSWTSWQCN